jgi:hypothetical protein
MHFTPAFLCLAPRGSIASSSSVLFMPSVASHHDRASLYGAILNKQHPMIQEWRARRRLHALAEEGHQGAALSFWA